MKVLKWLDDNLEACILVILLSLISIIMFMQIIMRFVFHHALNWPEEFCRICFVYSGFLCFSYAQVKRSSIRIDVLVNMLPEKGRKVLNLVGEVLLFAFYVFVFYHSIGLLKSTIANGNKTSALQIPIWFEYFALTLGMGLACLRSVEMFLKWIMGRKGAEQ